MNTDYLVTLASKLMRQYKPLPDGRAGDFEVVSATLYPGKQLTVVGPLESFHTGIPRTNITLTSRYKVQRMQEAARTWMTNLPHELVQMYGQGACNIHKGDRVLIGGLGLGIIVDMAKSRKPSHLTIVEISQDVINLNDSRKNSTSSTTVEIVQADCLEFLNDVKPHQYNTAFFDIWTSDNEWSWKSIVVPLRRKAEKKIERIFCWQENVMKSQVWEGLFTAVEYPTESLKCKFTCHKYAFRCAAVKLGYIDSSHKTNPDDSITLMELDLRNRRNPRLCVLAAAFINDVGTKDWEYLFGQAWDEALAIG